MNASKYVIGTSGYSFKDWVGPFYPPGTAGREMFDYYMRHFEAVELNFTFYSMPVPATLENMARAAAGAPGGRPFVFWVKLNQEVTHKANLGVCEQFLDGVAPLAQSGRLGGLLLQFPQSFHRTVVSRRYLSDACERLSTQRSGWSGPPPLAVEFRHRSWSNDTTLDGLRRRGITLVVPDSPDLRDLFHTPPRVTSSLGYLRLHTRNASTWYAGAQERYNYRYSRSELAEIIRPWQALEESVEKTYVFFNNCHGGNAAVNGSQLADMLAEL